MRNRQDKSPGTYKSTTISAKIVLKTKNEKRRNRHIHQLQPSSFPRAQTYIMMVKFMATNHAKSINRLLANKHQNLLFVVIANKKESHSDTKYLE